MKSKREEKTAGRKQEKTAGRKKEKVDGRKKQPEGGTRKTTGLGPGPGWGPYGPLWAHIWAYMGPYGPIYAPMWAHIGPPGQVLDFRKLSVRQFGQISHVS